jgi:hypothetical protein
MKIRLFPPSGRVVGIVALKNYLALDFDLEPIASPLGGTDGAADSTLPGDLPLVRGLGLTACLAGRACSKRCRAGVVALQEGGQVTVV